jgi:hypothetical protein
VFCKAHLGVNNGETIEPWSKRSWARKTLDNTALKEAHPTQARCEGEWETNWSLHQRCHNYNKSLHEKKNERPEWMGTVNGEKTCELLGQKNGASGFLTSTLQKIQQKFAREEGKIERSKCVGFLDEEET